MGYRRRTCKDLNGVFIYEQWYCTTCNTVYAYEGNAKHCCEDEE